MQAFGQLAHRYSFNSNANDSVGTAHGTVIDAGTTTNFSFTGGQLDLSVNTGENSNAITEDAYVDLPNGIISAAAAAGDSGEIAFEIWATISEARTWQRFWDFGTANGGEDVSDGGGATDYLSSPANSGRYADGPEITNHLANGAEPSVGTTTQLTLGTEHQLLAVYNHNNPRSGPNGTMSLYIDGALIGHNSIAPGIDLLTFTNNNNWLGRSQWGDPVFDGSFNEFRIYNNAPSDAYAASSFTAGPNSLAAFDPWVLEFDLSLEVNRDTGTLILSNAGPAIDIVSIEITTASGALVPSNLLSVTENYDSDSGGSFDPDNPWQYVNLAPTEFLLSEFESVGDGGQLGVGGTLQELQLGDNGAWTLSHFEDLVVTVQRLLPDFTLEDLNVPVNYVGGLGAAAERSDLDFDGDVDADDWVAFAANYFGTFESLTPAQSAILGDLDSDLDNDYRDFLLFESDYDAANGAGAFAAMLSGVPEPTSAVLLLIGSCAAVFKRRTGSICRHNATVQHHVCSYWPLVAIGLVLCGTRAEAQIVGTASGTFDASAMNGTFSYALQGGGNALVVGTYIDNNHVASNPQFAGVAANGMVQDQRMSLFYFFNPAASGDVTVNFDNTSPNGAYFVFELFDVDLGAPVDTGTGAAITTTVDNQFVLNFVADNNDAGDALNPATGSIATLAGVSNANGAIGGGSIGAAFADGRTTGAAGMKTLGWTGFGGGFEQGQVSAGFAAPALMVELTLVVNKTTGMVKIRNESAEPISFDYYTISSGQQALNIAGWNSLDDQNVDSSLPADFNSSGAVDGTDLSIWKSSYGVDDGADANGDGVSNGADFLAWQRGFGQAPTAANGWIEGGQSSSSQLGELFLDGATTLAPGAEVSLGAAYNTSVFGASDGDLFFDVSTADSTPLFQGSVVYVTGAGVAAVPEAGSISLCLGALLALLGTRRRGSCSME